MASIAKFTDIVVGTIGQTPANGSLKTLIDEIVDLSDAIVYHEGMIEDIDSGTQETIYYFVDDRINRLIKDAKILKNLLKALPYGTEPGMSDGGGQYHPAELDDTRKFR